MTHYRNNNKYLILSISLLLLLLFTANGIVKDINAEKVCDKENEYDESKLLELLGIQSTTKKSDCIKNEKQINATTSSNSSTLNATTLFRKHDNNTTDDGLSPSTINFNKTEICQRPGNDALKHMCCPVGQWPDRNGDCQSLF